MAQRLRQLRRTARLRKQEAGEIPPEEEESDVAVDGDVAAQFFKQKRVSGEINYPTLPTEAIFPKFRAAWDKVKLKAQELAAPYRPPQTATLTGQRKVRRAKRLFPEQYRYI